MLAGLVLALGLGATSERSLIKDLDQLDHDLANAETRLSELGAQRTSLQRQIAQLEADLASARLRRGEAWDQYQRRVRALARMPAGARAVLLGGSRSLNDYLEAARTLRWVAGHDRRLLDHYQAESQRLQQVEAALGSRRDELDQLEVAQRAERDGLAVQRNAKVELAQAIVRDKGLSLRWHAERSAAGRELADMLRRLAPLGRPSARFAQNRGRLPWPAVGPVDVTFGRKVEQTTGTSTAHAGMDIRAKAGSNVQAVARGEVAFADWLRGYGRVVIIDHGDKYHSIYAHLAALSVKAGDTVAPGSVLGVVGDTGSLRGTVLYFELRYQGSPIDPADWLRR